jgi:hypothetical protein
VLQSLIFLVPFHTELFYTIYNDSCKIGDYSILFDMPNSQITHQFNHANNQQESFNLTAKIDDYDDFLYFFKMLLLLLQFETIATPEHLGKKIRLT